jgi:Mn-containing catalase
MAQQIGRSDIADLLSKSLAEEENADNLLTQVSRELLSEARTGTSKLPEQLQIAEEEGEVVSARSSSSSSAKKRK